MLEVVLPAHTFGRELSAKGDLSPYSLPPWPELDDHCKLTVRRREAARGPKMLEKQRAVA